VVRSQHRGVDWTPSAITVLSNGQACLVDHPRTGSERFDPPCFIALTQALGVGTNAVTPGVTGLPATTRIDWVRAWSPASEGEATPPVRADRMPGGGPSAS